MAERGKYMPKAARVKSFRLTAIGQHAIRDKCQSPDVSVGARYTATAVNTRFRSQPGSDSLLEDVSALRGRTRRELLATCLLTSQPASSNTRATPDSISAALHRFAISASCVSFPRGSRMASTAR